MQSAARTMPVNPSSTAQLSASVPPTSARFWDRHAAGYAKKPVPDEEAYQRTLERVRAYLTPHSRVLELGCGTGTTALKLAPSAREILGTDYSGGMIAIATEKAREAAVTNVSFQRCTLDDATLGSGSFDVVLAMNFLHLLPELPRQLTRVAELLSGSGLFISKTPCIGQSGLALRVLIPLMRSVGLAPYVNFVTENSLRTDITSAGFTIEETGMYPQKSRSFFVVARKAT